MYYINIYFDLLKDMNVLFKIYLLFLEIVELRMLCIVGRGLVKIIFMLSYIFLYFYLEVMVRLCNKFF